MRPDLDILADATRRTILALLVLEQELCVCELEAALGLIQPSVSRQLALLRTSAWIDARREGRRIYYRIAAVPEWGHSVVRAYANGGVPAHELGVARARLAALPGRAPSLASAAS